MDKKTFLKRLRRRLSVLPQEEAERMTAYYGELIDDQVEEGMEETEAVENLGAIDQIIADIMQGTEIGMAKPARGFGGRLAAVIVSFPIWLPVLSGIWAVVVSFWASSAAFVLSGVLFLLPSAWVCGENLVVGIFQIGVCLTVTGLGIFWFVGTFYVTKYLCIWMRFLWRGIRYSFRRGGQQK